MNPCLVGWLLIFSLLLVQLAGAAPAVTSVHVSFTSGNKKTQYSHGTHTRPAVVTYNLDAAGTGDFTRDTFTAQQQHDPHTNRVLRSIRVHSPGGGEEGRSKGATSPSPFSSSPVPWVSRRVKGGPPRSKIQILQQFPSSSTTQPLHRTIDKMIRNPTTYTPNASTKQSTSSTGKKRVPLTFRTTLPTLSTKAQRTGKPPKEALHSSPQRSRLRSRVKFVEGEGRIRSGTSLAPTSGISSKRTDLSMTSSTSTATSTMPGTITIKSDKTKPKDSKAVKRSPYIENFESRGITFPDFDEFGGNEFGALRNFIGGSGGGESLSGGSGGIIGAPTGGGNGLHANPESLSPDGVFLPPLPTEASDYAEEGHGGHERGHGGGGHHDPYVTDPETAKYAAQHPPFFAAFPHKRTMLDLNERRVVQGLEPNILRSIRPFFAFFDAAK